jgi:5-methylcytosine-specific restriction protein A
VSVEHASELMTTTRPWRHWYGKKRWLVTARNQLATHPLCAMCLSDGAVTAASVVDHVEPHHGDAQMFWNGKLQSLCAPCHNKRKANIEQRGYDTAVGVDGYPIDPNHPANNGAGGSAINGRG